MVSINGVPLENDALDVRLMRSTERRPSISRVREALQRAGRDGVVAGLPSTVEAGVRRYVVECPASYEAALLSLVGDGGVLSDGDREVQYETVSAVSRELDTFVPRVEISITLRLPGSFWRAKIAVTTSGALASASVSLDVFAGLSAPVQDALVRVKGAASGIQVTDTSGAWVALPNVSASQWVRFESDTGRCFITTADTWSGGTDVSGQVDFGGPRGVFEITPVLAPGDPSSRKGVLTVATASRSGATIEIRGKGAYVL